MLNLADKLRCNYGFTLAEVLITLGIIGIVAALTIPTLLNKTNDAELKTAWKKVYSDISNAHSQMIASNELPYATPQEYFTALETHITTSKKCDAPQSEGCWHQANNWSAYNGRLDVINLDNFAGTLNKGYILNNGALVAFTSFIHLATPGVYNYTGERNAIALVDVNGFKKPNKMGADIFVVEFFYNKALPMGSIGTLQTDDGMYCNKNHMGSSNDGWTCSDNVILNVDY